MKGKAKKLAAQLADGLFKNDPSKKQLVESTFENILISFGKEAAQVQREKCVEVLTKAEYETNHPLKKMVRNAPEPEF